VGTVAETGGQPTPAEQVANIHRANLLGCEMLCFASNNTEVFWRQKHLVVEIVAETRLNSWLRAGGVPERARYESINSIFRVAGLKLVRPSVRALGTKGAMALALGLYAAQVTDTLIFEDMECT